MIIVSSLTDFLEFDQYVRIAAAVFMQCREGIMIGVQMDDGS